MSNAFVQKYAVCLPSISEGLEGGGHMHMIRFAEAMRKITPTLLVSYKKKEKGILYLHDEWKKLRDENYVLVLSWGGTLNNLFQLYSNKLPMVYFMKGQDFGDDIPMKVPVISNCQYLLSKAQLQWPLNAQLYLPECIEPACSNSNLERDIDVLVLARKQPTYILNKLVPKLTALGLKVHLQTAYIEANDLYELYKRSKTYVYAFAPMRTNHHSSGYRWMEGSATQTLEAMACGCSLLTNFRGGMCDVLEPPLIGNKIECVSLDWDVHQVQLAVSQFSADKAERQSKMMHAKYGHEKYQERLQAIHDYLSDYFQFVKNHPIDEKVFDLPKPLNRKDKFKNQLFRLKKRLKG